MKKAKIEQPKPGNKDIVIKPSMDESNASDIMNEIESKMKISQSTSSKDADMDIHLQMRMTQDAHQENNSFENEEQAHQNNYTTDRNISSKGSLKPAKVVFRKSNHEISRAERANKMAHFEYVESNLNNTHESIKVRNENRLKVNPQYYNSMNKNPRKAPAHSESKSMVMKNPQPLSQKKFSPKRFRRFPRFTIFLNKDQENFYEKENSISLNPQFLNFLMTPERAEIVDKGINFFNQYNYSYC